MYQIDEKVLKHILRKKSNSLVGKSCKRIEVIRDTKNIDELTKINLLRDLIKELVYENMREIEESISSFATGASFKINVKQ